VRGTLSRVVRISPPNKFDSARARKVREELIVSKVREEPIVSKVREELIVSKVREEPIVSEPPSDASPRKG
jgi:hypothetical protein